MLLVIQSLLVPAKPFEFMDYKTFTVTSTCLWSSPTGLNYLIYVLLFVFCAFIGWILTCDNLAIFSQRRQSRTAGCSFIVLVIRYFISFSNVYASVKFNHNLTVTALFVQSVAVILHIMQCLFEETAHLTSPQIFQESELVTALFSFGTPVSLQLSSVPYRRFIQGHFFNLVNYNVKCGEDHIGDILLVFGNIGLLIMDDGKSTTIYPLEKLWSSHFDEKDTTLVQAAFRNWGQKMLTFRFSDPQEVDKVNAGKSFPSMVNVHYCSNK